MFEVQDYQLNLPVRREKVSLKTILVALSQKIAQIARFLFTRIQSFFQNVDPKIDRTLVQLVELNSYIPRGVIRRAEASPNEVSASYSDCPTVFEPFDPREIIERHRPDIRNHETLEDAYELSVEVADQIIHRFYETYLADFFEEESFDASLDSFNTFAGQLTELVLRYGQPALQPLLQITDSSGQPLELNEETRHIAAWLTEGWNSRDIEEKLLPEFSGTEIPDNYPEAVFHWLQFAENESVYTFVERECNGSADRSVIDDTLKSVLVVLAKEKIHRFTEKVKQRMQGGIGEQVRELLFSNAIPVVSFIMGRTLEVVDRIPVDQLILDCAYTGHQYLTVLNASHSKGRNDYEENNWDDKNHLRSPNNATFVQRTEAFGDFLSPIAAALAHPHATDAETYSHCSRHLEHRVSQIVNIAFPKIRVQVPNPDLESTTPFVEEEISSIEYLLQQVRVPEEMNSLFSEFDALTENLLPPALQSVLKEQASSFFDKALRNPLTARIEWSIKQFATKQLFTGIQRAFRPILVKKYLSKVLAPLSDTMYHLAVQRAFRSERKALLPQLSAYLSSEEAEQEELFYEIAQNLTFRLESYDFEEFDRERHIRTYLRHLANETRKILAESKEEIIAEGLKKLHEKIQVSFFEGLFVSENPILHEIRGENWERYSAEIGQCYQNGEPIDTFMAQFEEVGTEEERVQAAQKICSYVDPLPPTVLQVLEGRSSSSTQNNSDLLPDFGKPLDDLILHVGGLKANHIFNVPLQFGLLGKNLGDVVQKQTVKLSSQSEELVDQCTSHLNEIMGNEEKLNEFLDSLFAQDRVTRHRDQSEIEEEFLHHVDTLAHLSHQLASDQLGDGYVRDGLVGKDHERLREVYQNILRSIAEDTLAMTNLGLRLSENLFDAIETGTETARGELSSRVFGEIHPRRF